MDRVSASPRRLRRRGSTCCSGAPASDARANRGRGAAASAVAYRPTANRYRLATPWLLFLPLAAAMTVDSAIQYRGATGGAGRVRVLSPQ
jgi:hypothetical protein